MSTSEPVLPAVGFDVGARLIHGVRLTAGAGRLRVDGRYEGGVSRELVDFCFGAARVAVDGPGGPSQGAHVDDGAVAPKFRPGRCSEIPVAGIPAVSWITPRFGSAVPEWMAHGFRLWAQLLSAGHEVVETFPAAVFHHLNGRRWPPAKQTRAGRSARVVLLAGRIDLPPAAGEWAHDHLDAAAAALVAAEGRPVPHACPRPDGSRLWVLPPA